MSTSLASSASSARNGPRSINARTSLVDSLRASAIPATSCPNAESTIFSVASLWAGVYFVSVSSFIAFLYSARWSSARDEAEFVERAAKERGFGHQAGETNFARGLEINLVERGGEVIRAVGLLAFAERLGVGDGGFAGVAEGDDGVANLLDVGQRQAGFPDTRDQADNAVVGGGALQGFDQVEHRRRAARDDPRHRIVRHVFDETMFEISFENHLGRDGLFRR